MASKLCNKGCDVTLTDHIYVLCTAVHIEGQRSSKPQVPDALHRVLAQLQQID